MGKTFTNNNRQYEIWALLDDHRDDHASGNDVIQLMMTHSIFTYSLPTYLPTSLLSGGPRVMLELETSSLSSAAGGERRRRRKRRDYLLVTDIVDRPHVPQQQHHHHDQSPTDYYAIGGRGAKLPAGAGGGKAMAAAASSSSSPPAVARRGNAGSSKKEGIRRYHTYDDGIEGEEEEEGDGRLAQSLAPLTSGFAQLSQDLRTIEAQAEVGM